MDAVGEEICLGLAGRHHTLEDVEGLFTRLAEREDSQYSYLNTLVAVDDDGKTVGVCVGYDGAKLNELRKPFLKPSSANLARIWAMSKTRLILRNSISTLLQSCLNIEAVASHRCCWRRLSAGLL